ncbi:WD repeat domain phosphoinositide-interacting protein 3 [Thecamonas trahens ATCC 50062]|uniref:WD repeat domain phosphoinositide-interacting protein 3 n=1 Tax=Thecamonas trahens ATCC 50062 TaxID=461836 RepID=A0A0L0DRQ1_THETB|nr:WD repeat domain phosphoinositide-interacting protein 3 [Thecamonas trahens ATCC 50062]KNC54098.1 WD repeat domain phosphoinositide-interacting protein 3 [Thecamonas trahens ATCC 50062]|eukprot:XP_013753922.1 WD repeat domain phosphoinositide-interacting protein 3 [Thecamonas trahens ATCC 50062]
MAASSATAIGSGNSPLGVFFNQDKTAFSVALPTGYRIYNTEPLYEIGRHTFEQRGGLSMVMMLFRTSTMALVGGGDEPQFAPVKVVIWDEMDPRLSLIELGFKSLVTGVRLSRAFVVVALKKYTEVYSLTPAPQVLFKFQTADNDDGVTALSPSSASSLLAVPDKTPGWVRIVDLSADSSSANLFKAHEHPIAIMEFNADATILATASTEGTMIRTWDTRTGRKLREVRRGKTKERICSIAFNYNSDFMAVSSLKGTIHIFSMFSDASGAAAGSSGAAASSGSGAAPPPTSSSLPPADGSPGSNSRSFFSPITSFLPKTLVPAYFSYEWSFAQYRMGSPGPTRLAFGREANILYVIGLDGSFSKLRFDPDASHAEVERDSYYNYLELEPATL